MPFRMRTHLPARIGQARMRLRHRKLRSVKREKMMLQVKMKISVAWLRRSIAACVAVCLSAPLAATAQSPGPQQPLASPPAQIASAAPQALPESPAVAPSQASSQAAQTPSPSTPDQQKPVGTAAAPYEKPTGVAASRPAGAVIAPAKQRRARSIVIRVGIVVGAAVAVGTVAGLSLASRSRPN